MPHRTGLALLAISGTLAGCGAASPPAAPQTGKALFARSCGGCHSLSGRESPRRQGGDLLRAHFSRQIMLQFASEMPVRRPLNQAELRAIANYVVSVQRRG